MKTLLQTLTEMQDNGWKVLGTTVRLSTEEVLYLVQRGDLEGALTREEMEEMVS